MKLSEEKKEALIGLRDMLLKEEIRDDWDPIHIGFMESCLVFSKRRVENEPYDIERLHSSVEYIKIAIQKLHRYARPIVRNALTIEDKHERFVTLIAIDDLFHQQMESEMFDKLVSFNDMKDIKELIGMLDANTE